MGLCVQCINQTYFHFVHYKCQCPDFEWSNMCKNSNSEYIGFGITYFRCVHAVLPHCQVWSGAIEELPCTSCVATPN